MNTLFCGLLILFASTTSYAESKDAHKVQCTQDTMRVDVMLPNKDLDTSTIYLEGLKGIPISKCQPNIVENTATFILPLNDFHDCGVTRIVNNLNGKKIFYHKVVIESSNSKEVVSVKCITTRPYYNGTMDAHKLYRRDVLPAGFEEPIELDITTTVDGRAPEPVLGVGVRQNGEIVTGELNVSPGTPLSMEIYLDKNSAPVYGIGVTYMQVTDTKSQEETIIFNGCSVDPYLFENFNTVDGDFLNAKFRAFKFPDSTYVQFRGTVNVCVDKCKGIQCSNGQIGYGRRKREVSSSADPNKVYEISMTTFIRVEGDPKSDPATLDELERKLLQLKYANQKLERNSRGSVFESIHDNKAYIQRTSPGGVSDASVVEEKTIFRNPIAATTASSASNFYPNSVASLLVILLCLKM